MDTDFEIATTATELAAIRAKPASAGAERLHSRRSSDDLWTTAGRPRLRNHRSAV
jgi:hypothetical protein